MCGMCGDSDEWTTPPGTEARRREYVEKLEQKILTHGHQVQYVFPTEETSGPGFLYTVGRALTGQPELFISWPMPPEVGQAILNEACRLMDEGLVLTDGGEFAEGVLGNVAFKVIACDTEASSMTMARMVGGDNITAFQLVWPDDEGRYPGDDDYNTKFEQELFPLRQEA